MPWEIFFKPSAEREFRRLPRDVQRRFVKALVPLAKDPTRRRRGLDVKPLRGVKDTWRLRVGDYRGIYVVEPGKITFTRFGHRSNIYDIKGSTRWRRVVSTGSPRSSCERTFGRELLAE